MSRRSWYRRNKLGTPAGTTSSTPIFLSSEDKPVPTAQGWPSGSSTRSKQGPASNKQGDVRLATATMSAADRYATLPLELRLAALCLPLSAELRQAA
jgi:hypothetical protein